MALSASMVARAATGHYVRDLAGSNPALTAQHKGTGDMMTWTANEVYVHPNPEKVNLISDCPKCYSGNWAVCARNNSGKYQITCNRDSCRHEYKVTLEARKHPF